MYVAIRTGSVLYIVKSGLGSPFKQTTDMKLEIEHFHLLGRRRVRCEEWIFQSIK